jgi:hypothetical protein
MNDERDVYRKPHAPWMLQKIKGEQDKIVNFFGEN